MIVANSEKCSLASVLFLFRLASNTLQLHLHLGARQTRDSLLPPRSLHRGQVHVALWRPPVLRPFHNGAHLAACLLRSSWTEQHHTPFPTFSLIRSLSCQNSITSSCDTVHINRFRIFPVLATGGCSVSPSLLPPSDRTCNFLQLLSSFSD